MEIWAAVILGVVAVAVSLRPVRRLLVRVTGTSVHSQRVATGLAPEPTVDAEMQQ